jgi:hypothetical protein
MKILCRSEQLKESIMTYYAYLTGIITILAFILQLKDIFPAHKEIIKSVDVKFETVFHPLALFCIFSHSDSGLLSGDPQCPELLMQFSSKLSHKC